jgi:hypothetical protein
MNIVFKIYLATDENCYFLFFCSPYETLNHWLGMWIKPSQNLLDFGCNTGMWWPKNTQCVLLLYAIFIPYRESYCKSGYTWYEVVFFCSFVLKNIRLNLVLWYFCNEWVANVPSNWNKQRVSCRNVFITPYLPLCFSFIL